MAIELIATEIASVLDEYADCCAVRILTSPYTSTSNGSEWNHCGIAQGYICGCVHSHCCFTTEAVKRCEMVMDADS